LLAASAVVLLAGCNSRTGSPQDAPPPAGAETAPPDPPPPVGQARTFEPGSFQRVPATDGTFTFLLPKGWTVKIADSDNGLVLWSPQGGTVGDYHIAVPADRGTVQLTVKGRQAVGLAPGAEEEALLVRMVSPRLSPGEVVRDYLPRINAPRMKDLRIVRTWDPSEAEKKIYQQIDKQLGEMKPLFEAVGMSYNGPNRQVQAIHYNYTFQGKRGNQYQRTLYRTLYPPPLLGRDATAMECRMQVTALDLPSTPRINPREFPHSEVPGLPAVPGANQWSLSFSGTDAPADVFADQQLMYAVVMRSVRMDWDAYNKKYDGINESFRKSAKASWEANRKLMLATDVETTRLCNAIMGYTPYYSKSAQRISYFPSGVEPGPGWRPPTEREEERDSVFGR